MQVQCCPDQIKADGNGQRTAARRVRPGRRRRPQGRSAWPRSSTAVQSGRVGLVKYWRRQSCWRVGGLARCRVRRRLHRWLRSAQGSPNSRERARMFTLIGLVHWPQIDSSNRGPWMKVVTGRRRGDIVPPCSDASRCSAALRPFGRLRRPGHLLRAAVERPLSLAAGPHCVKATGSELPLWSRLHLWDAELIRVDTGFSCSPWRRRCPRLSVARIFDHRCWSVFVRVCPRLGLLPSVLVRVCPRPGSSVIGIGPCVERQ
jgi:hypothetical protein